MSGRKGWSMPPGISIRTIEQFSMREQDAALKYCATIRNKAKKAYALAYLEWMAHGECGESPDRGALSYMAAQAVRMQLAALVYP